MSVEPTSPVLEVRSLVTEIRTGDGPIRPVAGVDLSVSRGEVVCLVGESGSGKSMLALSIMGVLPSRARIASGSVRLLGEELVGMSQRRLRTLRGNRIAIIPQDPMTALDPLYSVGDQIAETVRVHTGCTSREARRRALAVIEQVHLPDPPRIARALPSELSGGMNQRALIAMALATEPAIVIADEPTTALDVTVQAQVIEVLSELRVSHDLAVLLITHDMGVAAMIADRVVVMYASRVAEEGPTREIFARARHPYTAALIATAREALVQDTRFRAIPGQPPPLIALPLGCAFAPRCEFAREECRQAPPALREIDGGRVACVLDDEERPWIRARPNDRGGAHV